jgi:FtsZ-binding cell division protein ZapB
MAQKILSELSADEKLVVQTLRIEVLKAESALNNIKNKADADMSALKSKMDADLKDAHNVLQNAGQALLGKLRAIATDLKLDVQKAQFELDKLYFYENVAVTDVKDAVKKVDAVIDGEIKKVEAAASTVESEVKNVVGSIEKVL